MKELLPEKPPLEGQKRLKVLCCGSMRREAYHCAQNSRNIVDVEIVARKMHDTPVKLREHLAERLAVSSDADGLPYDAILLGYGLCSRAIAGLSSPVPLVAMRAHDCATILLGSRQKYLELFDAGGGIFWYSPGWIETSLMPGREKQERISAAYAEKYGAEQAKYLLEFEQDWVKRYSKAYFIRWPQFETAEYEAYTKACADYLGWQYRAVEGSSALMQKMFDGLWDEDFIVARGGEQIAASNCADKIIQLKI
ncbi:MAG: DUF1638 domain-containing protein [Phycisphaerae bacterium]